MLKVLYKVLQEDQWHLYVRWWRWEPHVAQWWGEKESAPM